MLAEEEAVFMRLTRDDDVEDFGVFSRFAGEAALHNHAAVRKERLEELQKEVDIFNINYIRPLREAVQKLEREHEVIGLHLQFLGQDKTLYEAALADLKHNLTRVLLDEMRGRAGEAVNVRGLIELESESWPQFPSTKKSLMTRMRALEELRVQLHNKKGELEMQAEVTFDQRRRRLAREALHPIDSIEEELVGFCEMGDMNAVIGLVQSVNFPAETFVNKLDSSGVAPIHVACASGNIDLVLYLISLGADTRLVDGGDGYAPVHWAVWGATMHPWEDIFELLLHHKSIDALGHIGRTALHTACHVGNLEVAHWLIRHGIQLNVREYEGARRTPLHVAAWRGFPRIVEMLLDEGCNPRYPPNGLGESAVFEAALAKKGDVLRVFVRGGYWLSSAEIFKVCQSLSKDPKGLRSILSILQASVDEAATRLVPRLLEKNLPKERLRAVTLNAAIEGVVVAGNNFEMASVETDRNFNVFKEDFESQNVVYEDNMYRGVSPYSLSHCYVKDSPDLCKSETVSVASREVDWNEEYQRRMEQSGYSHLPLTEKSVSYQPLAQFWDCFGDTVIQYGKVILSEIYIPHDRKTIKPVAGGIAGGEKYISRQIYFKLAVDDKGLYAKEPWWVNAPAKVAGLDLKGLTEYSSCQSARALSFPAMMLLDYLGHRLTCMSKVPIVGEKTLIFGSADGGKTVIRNEKFKSFASAMNGCLAELNLATYRLKDTDLATFDLEGHAGEDGRFYLMDYSRYMPVDPCVSPDLYATHLYRLLRPEIVRSNVTRLCPDAFAKPFYDANGSPEYRSDIKACHERLTRIVIPSAASELSLIPSFPSLDVTILLHSSGVNCRYFGKVHEVLRQRHPVDGDYWAFRIVQECITRCIKIDIRQGWRIVMAKNADVGPRACLLFAVERLNVVFGINADLFWDEVIGGLLVKKFDGIQAPKSGIRHWFLCNARDFERSPLCTLFHKVTTTLGIRLTPRAAKFFNSSDSNFGSIMPLLPLDFSSLDPVPKMMPLVHLCLAFVLKTQLVHSRDGSVSSEVCQHLCEALRSQPRTASAWSELSDMSLLKGDVDFASFCAKRAFDIAPDNADVVYVLGKVMFYEGDDTSAKKYWSMALELDPNHVRALRRLNASRS